MSELYTLPTIKELMDENTRLQFVVDTQRIMIETQSKSIRQFKGDQK